MTPCEHLSSDLPPEPVVAVCLPTEANRMSVASLSCLRCSSEHRNLALDGRCVAASSSTVRTSSETLGSSKRCLRMVRIEIPDRIRSSMCSACSWRSRLNSGDVMSPLRPRLRRSRHTQGIHSIHRAAIAVSLLGGRASKKGLCSLGSNALEVGEQLVLMVALQHGKPPQQLGIRPMLLLFAASSGRLQFATAACDAQTDR
jgi:hypothetical protein